MYPSDDNNMFLRIFIHNLDYYVHDSMSPEGKSLPGCHTLCTRRRGRRGRLQISFFEV